MDIGAYTAGEWYLLVQHELLLFAAAFFTLGLIDELAIDCAYVWLRLTGRIKTPLFANKSENALDALKGDAAVFLPAWREEVVIGPTLSHMLSVWPQPQLTIYVGCYRNDGLTQDAVLAIADHDRRVKLVIHERDGPTSKADCLNCLYSALVEDEHRAGNQARMILLHDAEDMVDPSALSLLDQQLDDADFLQLPVLALPQRGSPFVGSHYSDEFAESHGKTMVVRDAIGAAVPGAGVGSAISRAALLRLAEKEGGKPFAADSLTEDYELGLKISRAGGRGRFLRFRTQEGQLIATRAFFPPRLSQAIRQKTRWMHGISLQGWDRLGWTASVVEFWMQLRDRRGPLASFLLALAYLLVAAVAVAAAMEWLGFIEPPPLSPLLKTLLLFNVAGLFMRLAVRSAFTTREYGWRQGFLALPRALVSNVIAIVAGQRAVGAYIATLRGGPIVWDKTDHRNHPAHPPIRRERV